MAAKKKKKKLKARNPYALAAKMRTSAGPMKNKKDKRVKQKKSRAENNEY